jgi:hypothetical protein
VATAVSAIAGNAQAILSWSAPASDGGAAITSYTVTPYIAGVAQTAQLFVSAATTQTVTGLANGTAYTFTVTATNPVGPGPASTQTSPVTPGAGVASLAIQNGSGNTGRADQGDQIIITYPAPLNPASFCSSWTATSQPDLTGPNVVVTGHHPSTGNDTVASVTDTVNCAGGFHFGSIDLSQTGYFNADVTFAGSTIHWNGLNTLTITLGSASKGNPTQNNPSVAVYTPDPALGMPSTISSTNSRHF